MCQRCVGLAGKNHGGEKGGKRGKQSGGATWEGSDRKAVGPGQEDQRQPGRFSGVVGKAAKQTHFLLPHGGKIGKMPFEQLAVGQHGRGFHGVAQGVKIDFFSLPDKMIEGSKSGIGQNCPAQLAEIVTPQKRLFAAEKKTTLCLSCFQAGAQFSNFHDLPPLF